ncbi:MAG: hypothetical protein WBD45_16665 [Terriglobales bacterium]
MALDLTNLPADLEAEGAAIESTIAPAESAWTGVQKLIAAAKTQGLTSVTIADLEALAPVATTLVGDVETDIKDGEKIEGDL